MAYITADYYISTYKGTSVDDPDTLNRYLETASIIIDDLTHYALIDVDIETLEPAFIADRVKKAVAAQVDAFARAQSDSSVASSKSDQQTVTLGKFQIARSSGANDGSEIVPSLVYKYLGPTGLLFSGVSAYDGH